MAEGAGAPAAAKAVVVRHRNMPNNNHALSDEILATAVRRALLNCVIPQVVDQTGYGWQEVVSALTDRPKIVLKALRVPVVEDEQEQVFTSIPPNSTRTVHVKFRREDPVPKGQ